MPIAIVPVRAVPLFAATVNASEPLPLPFAPDVIEIHDPVAVALQEQSLSVETAIEPLPPV